jgi:hypothetical protein
MVLGFFELPEDEVPDEAIWHHEHRLEEWFAAIKQRRESGMRPVEDEPAEAGWAKNELTEQLIGGRS